MFTVAQSICIHYFCFENQGWIVTLTKKDIKHGLQNATGLLLLKKRRLSLASSIFEYQ
jgi:hypothetical protein